MDKAKTSGQLKEVFDTLRSIIGELNELQELLVKAEAYAAETTGRHSVLLRFKSREAKDDFMARSEELSELMAEGKCDKALILADVDVFPLEYSEEVEHGECD